VGLPLGNVLLQPDIPSQLHFSGGRYMGLVGDDCHAGRPQTDPHVSPEVRHSPCRPLNLFAFTFGRRADRIFTVPRSAASAGDCRSSTSSAEIVAAPTVNSTLPRKNVGPFVPLVVTDFCFERSIPNANATILSVAGRTKTEPKPVPAGGVGGLSLSMRNTTTKNSGEEPRRGGRTRVPGGSRYRTA
jgi:hypothetical protein